MEVAVSKAASTGLEGLGWACLHPRRKDGGSRQVEAPARFCAVEDGNFDSVFFVLCRFFFSLNVLARWPPRLSQAGPCRSSAPYHMGVVLNNLTAPQILPFFLFFCRPPWVRCIHCSSCFPLDPTFSVSRGYQRLPFATGSTDLGTRALRDLFCYVQPDTLLCT